MSTLFFSHNFLFHLLLVHLIDLLSTLSTQNDSNEFKFLSFLFLLGTFILFVVVQDFPVWNLWKIILLGVALCNIFWIMTFTLISNQWFEIGYILNYNIRLWITNFSFNLKQGIATKPCVQQPCFIIYKSLEMHAYETAKYNMLSA